MMSAASLAAEAILGAAPACGTGPCRVVKGVAASVAPTTYTVHGSSRQSMCRCPATSPTNDFLSDSAPPCVCVCVCVSTPCSAKERQHVMGEIQMLRQLKRECSCTYQQRLQPLQYWRVDAAAAAAAPADGSSDPGSCWHTAGLLAAASGFSRGCEWTQLEQDTPGSSCRGRTAAVVLLEAEPTCSCGRSQCSYTAHEAVFADSAVLLLLCVCFALADRNVMRLYDW